MLIWLLTLVYCTDIILEKEEEVIKDINYNDIYTPDSNLRKRRTPKSEEKLNPKKKCDSKIKEKETCENRPDRVDRSLFVFKKRCKQYIPINEKTLEGLDDIEAVIRDTLLRTKEKKE